MILVAGGTGRVGGGVVRLLTTRGESVRVLSRDPEAGRRPGLESIEIVHGDVSDPGAVARAVAGARTVVSTITGFGPGEAGPAVVDAAGNRALIRAARSVGAEHFILVSIAGAGPAHPLEIYRAKFQAEEELKASGLAWTVIRPTTLMETWAMVVGAPIRAKGRAQVFGRGDNPVNFVSANDVAGFVELAVLRPELRGVTLEVGGPENLTLNQVAALCFETCGRTGRISHLPLPVLRLASLIVPRLRPDIGRLIEAAVAMDTSDMTLEAGELRNRYPTVPISKFAEVVRRELVRESVPA
ncbi:MAG: NAD(P)H-binding protein [Candidatus Dormibacteraeota bacterium]|nr:NAD(P)H-binding protein [Candidatus Dormibacteraeota bacterium]